LIRTALSAEDVGNRGSELCGIRAPLCERLTDVELTGCVETAAVETGFVDQQLGHS
jgi:hypothetical protein